MTGNVWHDAVADELAYFDRGPIHEEHLILGGFWSAYWYDGRIYGTEIARGLDVLALEEGGADAITKRQRAGLSETLGGIADRLR